MRKRERDDKENNYTSETKPDHEARMNEKHMREKQKNEKTIMQVLKYGRKFVPEGNTVKFRYRNECRECERRKK